MVAIDTRNRPLSGNLTQLGAKLQHKQFMVIKNFRTYQRIGTFLCFLCIFFAKC
jgi:hypothetical protein